jgi:hypothetical protein
LQYRFLPEFNSLYQCQFFFKYAILSDQYYYVRFLLRLFYFKCLRELASSVVLKKKEEKATKLLKTSVSAGTKNSRANDAPTHFA